MDEKDRLIYQDSRIRVELDPKEMDGYILIVDWDTSLPYSHTYPPPHTYPFPRGTLEVIARSNIEEARDALNQMTQGLNPWISRGLDRDTVIAALTKAHYQYQIRLSRRAEDVIRERESGRPDVE
ncbi:hypothetical protein HYT24_01445 [Candidatus Pacearchaeota archaeon]|nr:hypothetical protein [Candidatus Pacearchaeota archaeon]